MFLTCNTKVVKYPHRSCSPWGAGAIWEIAENRTEGTAGGELRRGTLGVCVAGVSCVRGTGKEKKALGNGVGSISAYLGARGVVGSEEIIRVKGKCLSICRSRRGEGNFLWKQTDSKTISKEILNACVIVGIQRVLKVECPAWREPPSYADI